MRKFFKIFFWSLGTPVGYLGSLSQDPLGRIFSKCAFLNLLSPLALPLPSNVLGSSKKLKIFPRGCEKPLLTEFGIHHGLKSCEY